jgi:hypothetical protein
MVDLLLVDTENGNVEARLSLAEDGSVTITGEGRHVAQSILAGHMRLLNAGEAEAFTYLQGFGWANGPLALRPDTVARQDDTAQPS